MKICCISDLHGNLINNIPECDMLIIAGDICPATNHSIGFQKHWLEHKFNRWLRRQPTKHIVGIAGNHDWIFQKAPNEVPKLNWNYLYESSIEIEGYNITGHPWTPEFLNWAFNWPRMTLFEKHETLNNNAHILVTHGPPMGILDIVNDGSRDSKIPLGDRYLNSKIQQMPFLKLNVFGHIHSSHGMKQIDNVTYVNASILNEQYDVCYMPIVVNI